MPVPAAIGHPADARGLRTRPIVRQAGRTPARSRHERLSTTTTEHVEHGRDWRRPGRACRSAITWRGAACRSSSSTPTRDRRRLAAPLGLAAAVHAGAVRRARRHALSRAALPFPDQGRDGRLPRVVRAHISHLPVRAGVRVERSRGTGYGFSSSPATGDSTRTASSSRCPYQRPAMPAFAAELDPRDRAAAIRSTTGIPAQFRRAPCSSSARATPGRRSRSSRRATAIGHGWPAGNRPRAVPHRGLARAVVMRFFFASCSIGPHGRHADRT